MLVGEHKHNNESIGTEKQYKMNNGRSPIIILPLPFFLLFDISF